MLMKLRERVPRLRAAVARSINRMRAPELSFIQAIGEVHEDSGEVHDD